MIMMCWVDWSRSCLTPLIQLIIPANQDLKFRFRFVFHLGDEKQGEIENLYREYADIK
jgi:hypothetical protein